MELFKYQDQSFAPDRCLACKVIKPGTNLCGGCGKPHEPNEHFYGSKSTHFHIVPAQNGSTTITVTAELCEACYAEDMHDLTGDWPINFAPHRDKPSKTYGE